MKIQRTLISAVAAASLILAPMAAQALPPVQGAPSAAVSPAEAAAARRATLGAQLERFGLTPNMANVGATVAPVNYHIIETGPGTLLDEGTWYHWQGALLMPDPVVAGTPVQITRRLEHIPSTFWGYETAEDQLIQFIRDAGGRVVGTWSASRGNHITTQFDVNGDGTAELLEIIDLETLNVIVAAQEGQGVAMYEEMLNGSNPLCHRTRGRDVFSRRATGVDARAIISGCSPRAEANILSPREAERTPQNMLSGVCDDFRSGLPTSPGTPGGPRAAAQAAVGVAIFFVAAVVAWVLINDSEEDNLRQQEDFDRVDRGDTSEDNNDQPREDGSPTFGPDGSRGTNDEVALLGLCQRRAAARERWTIMRVEQHMRSRECVNPAEAEAEASIDPFCEEKASERAHLLDFPALLRNAAEECVESEERRCDDLPFRTLQTRSGRFSETYSGAFIFDTCDPRVCNPGG